MTNEEFIEMALSFPEVEANPHFERTAFKVKGKRIFATILSSNQTANLKLSSAQQQVYSDFKSGAIYPVPNKWGEQGWTTFEFLKIPEGLMLDALDSAYQEVFKGKKKAKN